MKKICDFCKNKELLKATFRLCSATTIVVTVFILFIGVSLGWFFNNTEVEATGMSINVQTAEEIEVEVTFYDVSSVSGNSITFDLSQEADATLPLYDFLDRKTHYVLMKMTAEEACVLTIFTDTTYRLDSTKPLLGGDGTGEEYSNWSSSVLFFEEVSLTDATCVLGEPDLFVNKSDYSFENTADAPCTFTYTITAGSPVYIVIGYDEDLLSKLYSENIGNSNINNGDVEYVNDCKFEINLGGDVS